MDQRGPEKKGPEQHENEAKSAPIWRVNSEIGGYPGRSEIPLSDPIANALDVLEGEQKMRKTITEQVEKPGSKVRFLVELTTGLQQEMELASVKEKERLKPLFQLLKGEVQTDDQAEQTLFDLINPHIP